jgi:hypothetical protein
MFPFGSVRNLWKQWHASIHDATYIHVRQRIHTYIHTHIHTYTHRYIHTHRVSQRHTCIHTYIHACIHTDMYLSRDGILHPSPKSNVYTLRRANTQHSWNNLLYTHTHTRKHTWKQLLYCTLRRARTSTHEKKLLCKNFCTSHTHTHTYTQTYMKATIACACKS